MKKVLVFGSFDPLHKGHEWFFAQAKAAGDYLLVVIARDSSIRSDKKREPRMGEQERLEKVKNSPAVDEVILGEERPAADPYNLLGKLEFDILALGYDQQPADVEVRAQMARHGREGVKIIRLAALKPEIYKSSLAGGNDNSY